LIIELYRINGNFSVLLNNYYYSMRNALLRVVFFIKTNIHIIIILPIYIFVCVVEIVGGGGDPGNHDAGWTVGETGAEGLNGPVGV